MDKQAEAFNNDEDEQITVTIASIPYFMEPQDSLSNVAAEVEVETTIECDDAVGLRSDEENVFQSDVSNCVIPTMKGNQVRETKNLQQLSSQLVHLTTTQLSTATQPVQSTAIHRIQATPSQPVKWGSFNPENLSLEQRLKSLSTQLLRQVLDQPVKMVPTQPIESTNSCQTQAQQLTTSQVLPSTSTPFIPSTASQALPLTSTQLLRSNTSQILPSSPAQSLRSTASQVLPSTSAHLLRSSTSQVLPSTSAQLLRSATSQFLPSTSAQPLRSSTSQVLPSTSGHPLRSTTSQVLPPTSAQHLRSTASQFLQPNPSRVKQQPTTAVTQINSDDDDIQFIAEFPVHPSDAEYYTEDEYSDELDEVEMKSASSTKSIQATMKNIMKTVCETEKPNTNAGTNVTSNSRVQPSASENAAKRTSCIQWIGKRKVQNPVLGLNLSVKRAASGCNITRPIPLHERKLQRNNTRPLPYLNNTFFRNEGPHSAEMTNGTKNVEKVDNMKKYNAYTTSTSACTAPFPGTVSTSTHVNQSIGEIQRYLQAPYNPIHPCCWHPCCIFMRELLIRLPWWRNHFQLEELLKIYFTYCQQKTSPEFIDPPESEWTVAKVYQVDVKDGTLRYKCKNCEGVVEHRSSKRRRQLNYGRLKYECSQCHRKYITSKQLRLHSLRHSKKTLACIYCDKLFLTQVELQNHLNTHTGEKPFCCPICFQKFAHSSRYYSHIRTFHKRYDCESCYYKVCATTSPPGGN